MICWLRFDPAVSYLRRSVAYLGVVQLMRPLSRESMAANKHVILFLATNPRTMDRLALDREARAIARPDSMSSWTRSGPASAWQAASAWRANVARRERP